MNDLDLSNPEVIESLKAHDVNKRTPSNPKEEEIQQAIESLDVPNDVTVQLSKLQVQTLQREAGTLGIDWRTHFNNRIQQEIFSKNIGAALISQPSNLSGMPTKKRISGPSYLTDQSRVNTPNEHQPVSS